MFMADQHKYYSLVAGRKEPVKVLQGSLNKKSLTPNPDAEEILVEVGTIIIPNHSRVWARRVYADATRTLKEGQPLDVKSPGYSGKLEFLKWGDPKGYVVDIRYLPNSQSLDKQYQQEVQKLWWEDEWATLKLSNGRNDIDEIESPLYAEMLKHHTLNIESPSRDPENTDWEYRPYASKAKNTAMAQKITERNHATNLVMQMEDRPSELMVAALLFEIDSKAPDGVLFTELLNIAETQTARFITVVNDRKKAVQELFNKALQLQVISIDKPKVITYYAGGKNELLLEVPEGEGTGMLIWVEQEVFNRDVYDAVTKLEKAHNDYVANLS